MNEMKGKVCIVTGANSGIGRETTFALANMGASVVMVVRNAEKGERARAEIVDKTGNESMTVMICDLSSMASIRQFAGEFKSKNERLDVLINNAGVVFSKRQVTAEGFERTLAVDYLGPFLLTHELLDSLKSSAPSRIVNLSSGLHKSAKINLDDLQSEKNYNGMKVYSNAKLMVIMFTYELARRLEQTGVTANVALPGFTATNLGRNSGSLSASIQFWMVRPFQIRASKGAETPVYLASSDEVTGVTGKCFYRMKEVVTAPLSYDKKLQTSLWDNTIALLGLTGT